MNRRRCDCGTMMKAYKIPIGSDVAQFYKSDNVTEYVCPFCGTVKWGVNKDDREKVIFT